MGGDEPCEQLRQYNPEGCVQELTDAELSDLSAALTHAKATGLKMYEGMPLDLTREKFPLPVLATRIAALAESLENGTGAVMISNFPVEGHSEEDIAIMYLVRGKLGRYGATHAPRKLPGRCGSRGWLQDSILVGWGRRPLDVLTFWTACFVQGVSAHIGRTVPQSSAGLRSVSRGYGLPLGRVQAEMSGKVYRVSQF
jgi:hypothetical protein